MNKVRRTPTDDARNPLAVSSTEQWRGSLRGLRRSTTNEFLGLPWHSVALGPDIAKGERRAMRGA